MSSKIKLQFNGIPTVGQSIALKPSIPRELKETFALVRSARAESTIGSSISSTRDFYKTAFETDFNGFNEFIVTNISTNQLEITHPDSGYFAIIDVVNSTGGNITVIDVIDLPDTPFINITDISFSQATVPCTHAKVNITTDVLATIVKVNNVDFINPNTNNPFSFDWVRGDIISIAVENANGEKDTDFIKIPKTLSVSNATISVVNSPFGATITISVTDIYGLTLQYSLDNTNWQTSNVYNSISEGLYTAHIKDQLGCSIQLNFTVENFTTGGIGIQNPVIIVPESNSFRFAERVDFATNHKNDRNTLSNEEFARNKRLISKGAHPFQTNDTPTNQFKTNYDNVTAVLIKEDLTEAPLVIQKVTNWMGLNDRMDAIKYDLGNGQTGLYFTSGNRYDFTTGLVTETYALNGGLPYWAQLGNYVYLENSWFKIENIIYDKSKFAKILVIENIYTGIEAVVDLSVVFDNENHEVYNFDTSLANYDKQLVRVRINFDDTSFDSKVWLSELIDVKVIQENTVEIVSYNDSNTEIYYTSGIKHLLRVPIERIDSSQDDTTEIHKSAPKSVMLNTKIFKLKTFTFSLMADGFKWQLIYLLSLDYIKIDGVDYIKNGSSVEFEQAKEDTNLYEVKATMLKSGTVHDSVGALGEPSFSTIEVPTLVEIGNTVFVKN